MHEIMERLYQENKHLNRHSQVLRRMVDLAKNEGVKVDYNCDDGMLSVYDFENIMAYHIQSDDEALRCIWKLRGI